MQASSLIPILDNVSQKQIYIYTIYNIRYIRYTYIQSLNADLRSAIKFISWHSAFID